MAASEHGLTLAEHYAAGVDSSCHRELVDGVLIVAPFPSRRHAVAAQRLSQILAQACPADLLVVGSAINVDREPATNLGPDLSVIRAADVDAPATEGRPLLVVEILSPSTRRFDMTLKRQIYAELAIPSYWLVDIDAPSLTVLELDGETYAEAVVLLGAERRRITTPFPIELAARDLVV